MINITNKVECCGCGACEQICPFGSIKLEPDSEGFLYPQFIDNSCVNCGLCRGVCPCLKSQIGKTPILDYAAINLDDRIRESSSSGGIFGCLANHVLSNKGVVYGANFDVDYNVEHSYIEKSKHIKKFLGSKYIQSRTSNSFKEIKTFLDSGVLVMFTGTPCQVSGLKSFLRKDYNNLITVDFICHGVPSPGVWQKYIKEIARGKVINDVLFRDKVKGWNNFSLTISTDKESETYSQTFHDDPYMQLFLNNYILRPSCYACKFKCGCSGSDITLADFWHIENEIPDMFDDKGASAVLINTEKGIALFNDIKSNLRIRKVSHSIIVKNNKAWKDSYSAPINREKCFKMLRKKSVNTTFIYLLHPERLIHNKVKNKIKSIIKKTISSLHTT